MEITCYDKYGRVIEKIVQWDVGQSISISGYDLTPYAPQIHFANANSEKALVVESVFSGGLLSCQVPNSLARENLPIIMYIYDAVEETGKTNTIIKIPVTPRPMPEDVVYTDDVGVISLTEVLRQAREYMNNSLNYSTKAKRSEEKAKTSADAAKVSETNAAKSESTASSSATQAAQSAKEAKAYVGSPLVANTISSMTDQTKVYVYTGSESGYTAGNWYYHNGSAWVSGGVYNSSAVNVDKTLTQDGYAADAKVTGDAVDSLKEDLSNKITKFYASNQGETHITDSDIGKIQDMVLYGKSEQNQYKGINLLPTDISYLEIIEASIPKGTRIFWATDGTPALGGNFRFYNEDKTQETWFGVDAGKTAMTSTMNIDAKYIEFLIPEEQSVKICLGIGDDPAYEPYTGGQPSPSPDYPQEIKSVVNPIVKLSNKGGTQFETVTLPYTLNAIPVSSGGNVTIDGQQYIADYVDVERGKVVRIVDSSKLDNTQTIIDKTEWLLAEQQETDLTTEQTQALKELVIYYPATNISVNSEHLDGYTVFNYLISMENGWNYVKKQLNDNRDYIYDMDLQSAEAYVNSEYAVTLTELEVM